MPDGSAVSLSTIQGRCFIMAWPSKRISRSIGNLSPAPIPVFNAPCSSVSLFSNGCFVDCVRYRSIGVLRTDFDHSGHPTPSTDSFSESQFQWVISSSPLLRGELPNRDWIEEETERRNRLIQESASMSGWSPLRLLENSY